MKFTIVGFGRMGKIYEKNLREMGYHYTAVLDKEIQNYSDEKILQFGEMTDMWIISNPTNFHLHTMERIGKINSRASILIEKPICNPNQFEELQKFIEGFQGNLVLSDIYGQSGLIDIFKKYIGRIVIKKVSIEFTKNRDFDENKGRTIDKEFGILGYEWFHMVSILKQILDVDVFQSYLRNKGLITTDPVEKLESLNYSSIEEYSILENGLELSLYSSIRGVILDKSVNDHCSKMDESHNSKKYFSKKIPLGSNHNFRKIQITSQNGLQFELHFEPFFESNVDFKNTHLMLTKDGNGNEINRHEIAYNQVQKFISKILANHPLKLCVSEYSSIFEKMIGIVENIK